MPKKCILILQKDSFCTQRSVGKVKHYFYYEVESVGRINTDSDVTSFSFLLNFYAKEYGAKKKILKFKCEEDQAIGPEIKLKEY